MTGCATCLIPRLHLGTHERPNQRLGVWVTAVGDLLDSSLMETEK